MKKPVLKKITKWEPQVKRSDKDEVKDHHKEDFPVIGVTKSRENMKKLAEEAQSIQTLKKERKKGQSVK